MKRKLRTIAGMLLLAIPLSMNAQVHPTKNEDKTPKTVTLKAEKPNRETTPDAKAPQDPKKPSLMPKISGLVQGLYQGDFDKEMALEKNTFRLRRVRMYIDGSLFKGLTYRIQGDFIRKPMLVDAYLKYKACDAFAIQIGQFKTPFTIETLINPVNLEIYDYGEDIQKLGGYSDICGVGAIGRDIGIMATGQLFPVQDQANGAYSIVEYSLGLFNGNGINVIDNNNRKDLVGRLDVHPGMKHLTLSGSYYHGYYTSETSHGLRNRWAAGAQYNDGALVLRSEYVSGRTGFLSESLNAENVPALSADTLHSNGYYAVAGYNFKFGKQGKEQTLMPVVRYEHFANDRDDTGNCYNYYTVGLNYWPLKSVNIKLDYSLIQQGDNIHAHRVVGLLSYKF